MEDSTLLALLTVVSMLCAISMAAFAYKLNADWAEWNRVTIELFWKLHEDIKKLEDKHGC